MKQEMDEMCMKVIVAARVWNEKYPPGTDVIVTKDDGSQFHTKTRSHAGVLNEHTAVVWVDGTAGCYDIERVRAAEPTAESVKPEPELYCHSCGRKLEDSDEIEEEAESPRVEGCITCDNCYHGECCDRCVVCDDYMRKEDTKYVLFADEFQGVMPGCYKFKRPWFADGMIEIHIFQHALTKIRDLHKDEEDSGYVCDACALGKS